MAPRRRPRLRLRTLLQRRKHLSPILPAFIPGFAHGFSRSAAQQREEAFGRHVDTHQLQDSRGEGLKELQLLGVMGLMKPMGVSTVRSITVRGSIIILVSPKES